MDPGQAFGTGAHPTTRLSLELLLGLEPRGSLADLGCGSGVLALAAARLGFAPVTAVDSEQAAVEATLENARVNGDRARPAWPRSTCARSPAPAADVVAANLVRPLLLRVAELMERAAARADRVRAARGGGGRGGRGVRADARARAADRRRAGARCCSR